MCFPNIPAPPKPPDIPRPPTPVDPSVLEARQREKQAAAAASGFRSTILTGPRGVGSTFPDSVVGDAQGVTVGGIGDDDTILGAVNAQTLRRAVRGRRLPGGGGAAAVSGGAGAGSIVGGTGSFGGIRRTATTRAF